MILPRPPLIATWMLRHLTGGRHSEALQGDLLEAWHGGRSGAWYWRQVLIAVAASVWRWSIGKLRWNRLWIALAAIAITALLTVAAFRLASFIMEAAIADAKKWWWPPLMHVLMFSPLMTGLWVSIVVRRRVRRRHQ
jgi:hypothetical protein